MLFSPARSFGCAYPDRRMLPDFDDSNPESHNACAVQQLQSQTMSKIDAAHMPWHPPRLQQLELPTRRRIRQFRNSDSPPKISHVTGRPAKACCPALLSIGRAFRSSENTSDDEGTTPVILDQYYGIVNKHHSLRGHGRAHEPAEAFR